MLVDILNQQVNKAEVNLIIINNLYSDIILDKIDNRVKIIFINRGLASKNPMPILKLNTNLLKLDSDVIHCHNHNIVPLILPSCFFKKRVLTVHDVGVEKTYFKLYNKLFAISKIVKNDIKNSSDIDAILVYNGIQMKSILRNDNFERSKNFKILIVSRLLHEKKGQHVAIQAMQILKNKGVCNIKLDLIGDGPSDKYLHDLVDKYELKGQVNFIGLKDRSYVYNHLKDYNLLLQPSLYEGFGLTVAEGMAAYIPVLVSDIDGPMEIINEGKYGNIFEAGNPKSLADQIQLITLSYSNIEFKDKIDLAYQHVTQNFNISKTACNYMRFY